MNPARVTPFAVSIAALLVYLRTLCPTIFAGDSGELASAASTLGIAHPPGYPLWVLLGHLATRLTPQEPALGTNLLSALCAAAAAGVLAATLLRLRVRPVAAAAAALGYALATGPWSQAVITEVYALNQLLTSLAVWFFVNALDERDRALRGAALVFGLGLANHPLVLLAAVPYLALGRERLLRDLPARAGLLLLGASFYFWIPIRAAMDPVVEWGAIGSLADVLGHVTRLQYQDLAASDPLPVRLRVFGEVLVRDVPIVVLLLAAASLVRWREGHRRATFGLWSLLLASGPLLAAFLGFEDSFRDRTVVAVFFLTATLAAWLLAGLGLERLLRFLPHHRAFDGTVGAALLLAVGLHGWVSFQRCDRSGSTLARDYAREVLESLPPDSRIYAVGDNEVFAFAYAQLCLKIRPDVEVMDRSLNLFVERYGDDFAALDREERRLRQIEREAEFAFAALDRSVFYASRVVVDGFGGCRLVPTGMVWQLLRPGEARIPLTDALDPMPTVQADDALESMLAAGISYRGALSAARDDQPERAALRLEDALRFGGRYARIQVLAGDAFLDLGDRPRALECFERALVIDPENESALRALAMTHRDGGAARYLARLVELGSTDPVLHVLHALQLTLAGDLAAARDAVRGALRLSPDLAPARELEAVIVAGLSGDGARAREEASVLRVRWLIELARAQMANGRYGQAASTFAHALELDPTHRDAARQRGFALMQARRFEEAGEAFRRLLDLDPESAAALNALAYVYAVTGDRLDDAARMARQAIDTSPQLRPYALDTLGWARFRAGDAEEALTALSAAAEALPESDPSALAENAFHRAMAWAATGRIDLATRAAKEARAGATDEFWIPELDGLERRLAGSP